MNYQKAVENIRKELEDYIKTNKLRSLVLGVSGGMDSCLVAALASPVCKKLNIPLIGVSLPSESNEENEILRAELTLEAFCDKRNVHFIDSMYKAIAPINKFQFIPEINDADKTDEEVYHRARAKLLELGDEKHKEIIHDWKIRRGNIYARIRMIYLYNIASMYNGLVLSTDNYTEYLLGFWTLHGDVGDYGMIQELWKTEVYEMAEYLYENEYLADSLQGKIIKDTIDAKATDGLGVTNLGDLGQILPGWTGNSRDGYEEVDGKLKIWKLLNEEAAKTPKVIKAMTKLAEHPAIIRHLKSSFKRKLPININRNQIN